MIKGIGHVCYTVKNIEVSIDFYTNKLGFKHAFDFRNEKGERGGAYLKIGNEGRSFIELFQAQEIKEVTANTVGYQHLCIEVDDINQTKNELNAKGIETTEPYFAMDNAWQIWIEDPDGNRIEMHQYTDESWQTPFV